MFGGGKGGGILAGALEWLLAEAAVGHVYGFFGQVPDVAISQLRVVECAVAEEGVRKWIAAVGRIELEHLLEGPDGVLKEVGLPGGQA